MKNIGLQNNPGFLLFILCKTKCIVLYSCHLPDFQNLGLCSVPGLSHMSVNNGHSTMNFGLSTSHLKTSVLLCFLKVCMVSISLNLFCLVLSIFLDFNYFFSEKRRQRMELSRTKVKIGFLVTNSVLLRCMGAAVYAQPGERAAWRAPAGLSCPVGYASIKRLKMLMSPKITGQE